MKKFLLLLTLLCACVGGAVANNIRIIGLPVVKDQNTKDHTVKIKFDLAWDNSWRTSKPDNYDAAWLFVKCWDGESWNHVYLDTVGAVPGSKTAADAVTPGTKYSVTSRDGTITDMDMMLEPGYSMAWKKWHLDPKEEAVRCVVGFFLYRKGYGAGHVVVPGITFVWNYGNQGFVDEDDLVVKVFAVEMVYVPKGDYYLGGRGTAGFQYGSFTTSTGTVLEPMVITSENAIKVDATGAVTTLWALNNGMVAGEIPAAFPKGHQAFYIMKYELTQEAWCEFLNSLNQGQQNGRVNTNLTTAAKDTWAWGGNLSAYRNFVKIKQAAPFVIFGCDANLNNNYNQTDSVEYDGRKMVRNIDGQDLAMNFVSFNDLLAYAEFAGLRPMTELEYEKACRGTREPVNDEYAWGSVTAVFYGKANSTSASWTQQRDQMSNISNGQEALTGGYNVGYVRGWSGSTSSSGDLWWARHTQSWTYSYNYYPAVLRVGIFASPTSTRAEAGATFWGVMNMSDNVAEMCISAVDTAGRGFTGVHGCGQLDPNGAAFCKGWNIVNHPSYYILRGMMFNVTTIAATNSVTTPWQSWWSTNSNWWACANGRGAVPGVPADYTKHNTPRVGNNEIGWDFGNMNRWEYYAGMISSRHMVAHTVALSDRSQSTNAAQAAMKPMRGIRCVRTARAAK